MSSCLKCYFDYYKCIADFFENDEKSIEYLRLHGVLPNEVTCPSCNDLCIYEQEEGVWHCNGSEVVPDTKKRRYCEYSVPDFKGSFLDNTDIPAWKVVLFVNHFLSHLWDHKTMVDCLDMSANSSVCWRSFCWEVTDDWFQNNQEPIGGEGIEVEIDQTMIVRGRFQDGRYPLQNWLFGGIERGSNRRFIVALSDAIGEEGDEEKLLPLIKKYVRPGSVIYSDFWAAYKISGIGYKHSVVKDTTDSVHKENKEKLWHDVKDWVKKSGIWSKYLNRYLARYLFICSVEYKESLLHEFFIHAAKLYKPLSERQRRIVKAELDEDMDERYDGEEDEAQKPHLRSASR